MGYNSQAVWQLPGYLKGHSIRRQQKGRNYSANNKRSVIIRQTTKDPKEKAQLFALNSRKKKAFQ